MSKPRRKVLTVQRQRTLGQLLAAAAGAFLPVASYVISHHEVLTHPVKWLLVLAALAFSAPVLVEWAMRWCRSWTKALGFTVLLEGVMVFSSTPALALTGLGLLLAINCHAAYHHASGRVK